VSLARTDWRARVCVAGLLAVAGQGLADQSSIDREAPIESHNGLEVRRVWVLSDPSDYGSGNGRREIVVYELVCEEGKLTKMSEGFEVATGPKFGEGWVLRAQTGLTPAAAQKRLERALADVCGI
jgi:hypothetical protein